MHTLRTRAFLAVLAAASGCHLHDRSHSAVDGAVLGRVVIYRNGVAFYERKANAHDGQLTVHVPRDRVDDFLKSLTVTDPSTGKPLSVTIPRKEDYDGSSLTMTLETPDNPNAEVLLTYVTEAPAWKPSYRVVVGANGKVMLEGWAIVDNVTGEDWKGVLVGVGASSALAFRYDLWSVRRVDRDLLAGEERFATAPPTGMSPYANSPSAAGAEELTAFDGDEAGGAATIAGASALEDRYYISGVNTTGTSAGAGGPDSEIHVSGGRGTGSAPAPAATATANVGSLAGTVTDGKTHQVVPGTTVIATTKDGTVQTAVTDEAGRYHIDNLPAGPATVSYYYGDATEEQHVRVAAAKSTSASYGFRTLGPAPKGETITITARAPIIDPPAVATGITSTSDYSKNVEVPGRTFEGTLGAAAGSRDDSYGRSFSGSTSAESRGPSAAEAKAAIVQLAQQKMHDAVARVLKDKRDVLLEIHGTTQAEASARGAAVRDRLVDEGVPATRVHLATKIGATEPVRVRVLAVAPGAKLDTATAPPQARGPISDTPVGESRFMADRPMTVKAGSSAMVAMVHSETTGGVVYLYDPVSDRGDARFAFRSVQLDNPTGDTLEAGPVTVYGDKRFIGEGITEPVPPHASVVVPFALDKQIIVEHAGDEDDRIAKLVTVQRGIVTAQIQHRRTTTLTLTSRLTVPAKVYLRHKLEAGWTINEAPPVSMRVGDSKLYEIDLPAGGTQKVVIAEATPMERTLELSSQAALDMMKVYVDDPEATPELVDQLRALLATHRGAVDLVDKIATLRDELVDYRVRAGELHGQLVTLKLVHTSGDLMAALRTRLAEISERIQKTTIAIVDAQEALMLARVKFGNQLADLRLSGATAPVSSR